MRRGRRARTARAWHRRSGCGARSARRCPSPRDHAAGTGPRHVHGGRGGSVRSLVTGTPSSAASAASVATVGFPRPDSSPTSVALATPARRARSDSDRPRATRTRRTFSARTSGGFHETCKTIDRAIILDRCYRSSADVVVVGAGGFGTSIAFHLAARGADVVLIDRSPAVSETSAMAAGIAMQVHPTEAGEPARNRQPGRAGRPADDAPGARSPTSRPAASRSRARRSTRGSCATRSRSAAGSAWRSTRSSRPRRCGSRRGCGATTPTAVSIVRARPALRAGRPAAPLPGGRRASAASRLVEGVAVTGARDGRRRRHRRRDRRPVAIHARHRRARGRRLDGGARGGRRRSAAGRGRPPRAVRDRPDRRHRRGDAARARDGRQRLRAAVPGRPDGRRLRGGARRGRRHGIARRPAGAASRPPGGDGGATGARCAT